MSSSVLYGELRTARIELETCLKRRRSCIRPSVTELILFFLSVFICIYCIVLLYCRRIRSWTQNLMNTRQAFEH